MILRNYMGIRKSVGRQHMSAHMLLGASSRIPNFPVVKETYRELLEDVMDLKRAREFLQEVEQGKRVIEVLDPYDVPSPFSHNLITQGMSDAIMMQDRKELLAHLYDLVVERVHGKKENERAESREHARYIALSKKSANKEEDSKNEDVKKTKRMRPLASVKGTIGIPIDHTDTKTHFLSSSARKRNAKEHAVRKK